MKAALCKSLDGARSLVDRDGAGAGAGPGQAIVRVEAVGFNFADTPDHARQISIRSRICRFLPVPRSPASLSPFRANLGTFAWPARHRLRQLGRSGRENRCRCRYAHPGTGRRADDSRGRAFGDLWHGDARPFGSRPPETGETVVVTGAAGGAGQAAVEIAKLMGARVIAVASSPEKCAIAKAAGADETIAFSRFPGSDLKAEVRALTDGNGADVVYDCIGGEASEPLVRALAWQGRFLVVGFAAGEIPKIPLNLLLLKGAEMAGVFWGEAVRRDAGTTSRQHAASSRLGRRRPPEAAHPCDLSDLEQIGEALSVLERREATGKVVLTIAPD